MGPPRPRHPRGPGERAAQSRGDLLQVQVPELRSPVGLGLHERAREAPPVARRHGRPEAHGPRSLRPGPRARSRRMTGSGGFGGYAPFKFGSVRPEPLRELVPGSEELIDHVLQGLSPRRVIEGYMEGNLGVAVTDNTKELYLSTAQPDIDELY